MFLLINPLIPDSAICQDEIPACGKETNKVHTCGKLMTKTNYSLLFLPIDKDGCPDHRFNSSLDRIRANLGEQTINELIDFCSQTSQLQKGYAKQGLAFAVAVLKEASYLHKYHRFDQDNPYGYKSKVLKKQAQQTLERIGFTNKNANKLVATADWLTQRVFGKDEEKWFESLTPSHLYELSCMSEDGFNHVQQQVSYPEFKFSAGQKEISVRRLEEIRRAFPKHKAQDGKLLPEASEPTPTIIDTPCLVIGDLTALQPAADAAERTTEDMVIELVTLAQSIDWQAVQDSPALQEILTPVSNQMMLAAHLAVTEQYIL